MLKKLLIIALLSGYGLAVSAMKSTKLSISVPDRAITVTTIGGRSFEMDPRHISLCRHLAEHLDGPHDECTSLSVHIDGATWEVMLPIFDTVWELSLIKQQMKEVKKELRFINCRGKYRYNNTDIPLELWNTFKEKHNPVMLRSVNDWEELHQAFIEKVRAVKELRKEHYLALYEWSKRLTPAQRVAVLIAADFIDISCLQSVCISLVRDFSEEVLSEFPETLIQAIRAKKTTTLHWACSKGLLPVVTDIILDDTDHTKINAVDGNGATPLVIASQRGHAAIVDCLLTGGADAFIRTIETNTALIEACWYGHEEVCKVFNKHNCFNMVYDGQRRSLLHFACRSNNLAILKGVYRLAHYLRGRKDSAGHTALHEAVQYGSEEMVHFLLDKGVDVNARTNCEFIPLHFACERGHEPVVRCLLEHGALINATDINGATPFEIACSYGHVTIARLLAARENSFLDEKNTRRALNGAICGGHLSVVKYLFTECEATLEDVAVLQFCLEDVRHKGIKKYLMARQKEL